VRVGMERAQDRPLVLEQREPAGKLFLHPSDARRPWFATTRRRSRAPPGGRLNQREPA
jgi:hypothetical protein